MTPRGVVVERYWVRCSRCEWVGWRFTSPPSPVDGFAHIKGRSCPRCGGRDCVAIHGPQTTLDTLAP